MNDSQLLRLSAEAAGLEGLTWRHGSACFYYDDPETGREEWNPLCDDGQAFRLAVKLKLLHSPKLAHFLALERFTGQDADDMQVHRRAIVLAAADTVPPLATEQEEKR